MMVLTHAFMSVSLAMLTFPSVSRYVPPPILFVVAFLGGVFPDLDLFINHRKAFHFPVWFPISAVVTGWSFFVLKSPVILVLLYFLMGAALHSVTDILAGSVEFAPWDPSSNKAVYNHFLGTWHTPRRWIRYSGAPEDFVLAAMFALPVAFSTAIPEMLRQSTFVLLIFAAVYTLVRKRIRIFGDRFKSIVPHWVRLPKIRFEE